jgi:AcrR family transcriptional regulator
MATRSYNNVSRQLKRSELRARIAAAAAELHAIKGAVATSYAEIAQRAGVSLPTVYNHFPDQQELIGACTSHVAAQAPMPAFEQMFKAADLPAAAELLVADMDKLNAYFEPWLAWREQSVIPALAEVTARERKQQVAVLAELLSKHSAPGDPHQLAAVWETLLGFDVWHRMVREHRLPRTKVRALLLQLLLAVVGPQPAVTAHPRPRRKS